MAENQTSLDVPALFHAILFAYQKSLKNILGSGEAIFVQPVLETLDKLDKEKGLHVTRGKNADAVLENFALDLVATQTIKKASFEKKNPRGYNFCVEGCVFAGHIHHLLNPKDVVCPLALVAMAVYQSSTGERVKVTESEFTAEGSKTLITS